MTTRYALIFTCVLGCAHASPSRMPVAASSQTTGVHVRGSGEAEAPPDLARFTVGVEVRRPTLDEARLAAAAALQGVLDALRQRGIQERDLQTHQLSLAPDYDYSERGRRLLGYVAQHGVEVRITDMAQVGTAVDAAARAGGDDARVQGVSFELLDASKVRTEARERAVDQAKATAESLARLGGVELGELVFIGEDEAMPEHPRPMMMQMRSEMQADQPTPVAPGLIKVRVDVRAIYAIR